MSVPTLGKKSLRLAVKQRLATLTPQEICSQSSACIDQLLQLPSFQNSKSLSIYLSMQFEVQTQKLIECALHHGKVVFIPKVLGKDPTEMTMVPLRQYEDILSFPKNSWGIPEPPFSSPTTDDAISDIDLVVVPGVAFAMDFTRLGHGKGYYGGYLHIINCLYH
jgi:5-formyltetrahydrofolate cyclo-ligase